MRWGKLFVASNKQRLSLGIGLVVVLVASVGIISYSHYHAATTNQSTTGQLTPDQITALDHEYDVPVTLSDDQFTYLANLAIHPDQSDDTKNAVISDLADQARANTPLPPDLKAPDFITADVTTPVDPNQPSPAPVVTESPQKTVFVNSAGYTLSSYIDCYYYITSQDAQSLPPVLKPNPNPSPTPTPTPIPYPCPTPLPTPTPEPSPIPTPTPQPTPFPNPVPWPGPIPAPLPDPGTGTGTTDPGTGTVIAPGTGGTIDPGTGGTTGGTTGGVTSGSGSGSGSGTGTGGGTGTSGAPCIDPNNKLSFTYDAKFPAEAKTAAQKVITDYTNKIIAFWGPPAFPDKVTIRSGNILSTGAAGQYSWAPPTITIDNSFLTNLSDPTRLRNFTSILIHEIGHAWLGRDGLFRSSVLEEGRARALEDHLGLGWNTNEPDNYQLNTYDQLYRSTNFNAYLYRTYQGDGSISSTPYIVGAHLYGKLYLTYPKFFPEFYCKWVAALTAGFYNDMDLAKLTIYQTMSKADTPKVDGMNISTWISQNGPFLDNVKDSYYLTPTNNRNNSFILGKTGYYDKIPYSAKITLYDLRWNVLTQFSCQSNNLTEIDIGERIKCPLPTVNSFPRAAVMSIVVTSPKSAANEQVFYDVPWRVITKEAIDGYSEGPSIMLTDPTNADSQPVVVTVTNPISGERTSTTLKHGIIQLDSDFIHLYGRLRIDNVPCASDSPAAGQFRTMYYTIPNINKLSSIWNQHSLLAIDNSEGSGVCNK